MIVLGITPGLRSLAYCVLFVRSLGAEPELIDSDLLKGGIPEARDEEHLKKKARPHTLTLHIVLERAFELNWKRLERREPVVMAIGPAQPNSKEPAEWVYLVRAFLIGLGVELRERGIEIECLNWSDKEELDDILGVSVQKAVRRQLNGSSSLLIRTRYVLAAGTALAAIKKTEQLQQLAPH